MDATQALYTLLKKSPKFYAFLSDLDKLALIVAGICHDVDHPGTNFWMTDLYCACV